MTRWMSMLTDNRYMPAEWECAGAVMLSWPHEHTDWSYMLDRVRRCYTDIAEAISLEVPVFVVAPVRGDVERWLGHLSSDKLHILQLETNDTWIRDYGPVTVRGGRSLMDFGFNGWGLKFAANLDNTVVQRLCLKHDMGLPIEDRRGFILEGGSIDSDGQGNLLTTTECLLSPNRNPGYSRDEIELRLCEWLGVEKVLWLNHGCLTGDDTDGHIDTIVRFAPHETILFCEGGTAEQVRGLENMANELKSLRRKNGLPWNLIGLPLPEPVRDEDDNRILPATYANFLALGRTVLVPTYGQARMDDLAQQIIGSAFPDHNIIGVDCRALVRQNGSLHCATMQVPAQLFKI